MGIKPTTVTKLNNYIKGILASDGILRSISVDGEVSNLKVHHTGIYLSLKDEESSIDCYINRSDSIRLQSLLDNGMRLIAKGNVGLHAKQGRCTFYIKDIEVAGRGSIELAFEKIKQKLEAEGLFDLQYKKEIPAIPEKIAIVTSESGAAIADMLKIIKNKNTFTHVNIFSVLVQGELAAGEIAAAIDLINAKFIDEIDTIIVGRGGGSREDLWAFNEEIVARAIFHSKIPIISAVGHEVDFTIADFVADMRAPTPTAAADMAVPSTEDLLLYLQRESENLDKLLDAFIYKKEKLLDILHERLEGLNPKNAIKRGFAAVLDENNNLVKEIKKLKRGETFRLLMSEGTVTIEVVHGMEECKDEK